MRYIFIYYNIIYLILLILIFIYIKKVLNNCYNIETFEETSNTLSTEKNNKRNRNILIKKIMTKLIDIMLFQKIKQMLMIYRFIIANIMI